MDEFNLAALYAHGETMRLAREERQKAADRGLTLAEHYRDLALEAAIGQANRLTSKLSGEDDEAILRWSIEQTPGIRRALSASSIASLLGEAIDVYHDRRAQIAAEGGAGD